MISSLIFPRIPEQDVAPSPYTICRAVAKASSGLFPQPFLIRVLIISKDNEQSTKKPFGICRRALKLFHKLKRIQLFGCRLCIHPRIQQRHIICRIIRSIACLLNFNHKHKCLAAAKQVFNCVQLLVYPGCQWNPFLHKNPC